MLPLQLMISKAKMKFVRSLEQRKHRKAEGVFVAEGPKVVGELMATIPARMFVATANWLQGRVFATNTEIIEVTEEELRKVSFLQHPQEVLAIFEQPQWEEDKDITTKLSLALDDVQDPGNLGTIIRVADWFGIENVYCSENTADVYNPKVIQATMGSLARVKVIYRDLGQLIDSLPDDFPIYGTMLDGEDIYQQTLTEHGLIIMGNEGKGISPAIAAKVNRKLLIPNYPVGKQTVDSLNVAIATAITCSEFRRHGTQH